MEKVLILHSGPYHFDKRSKKFELSELAKLRLLACASLYRKKTINKIILTGGSVFGKGKPTVSVLSIPFLAKNGVSKKDLIIEDKAKDTVGEIRLSLPKVLGRKIFVLSDSEHLKRIKTLYSNHKVKAEFLSAEEILRKKISGSFYYKIRETLIRLFLVFDKKGIIFNELAVFLRRDKTYS